MTKLDAGLMTSLPASDPGSAAVWGSKRINPRPQFCLCLAWSGCPSNDDDDDDTEYCKVQQLIQPYLVIKNKQNYHHTFYINNIHLKTNKTIITLFTLDPAKNGTTLLLKLNNQTYQQLNTQKLLKLLLTQN